MLGPGELAASITAAAIAISHSIPDEKITLLGAVFTQLGDTLATIAATRDISQLPDNSAENASNNSSNSSGSSSYNTAVSSAGK